MATQHTLRCSEGGQPLQVGNIEGAKQAIEAGADGIIVQGLEVGGHVLGQCLSKQMLNPHDVYPSTIPYISQK
ncbi:hypothetical protein PHAVU_003G083100 [Phaseolus vulgaris]|uniref:Nitronate monooxygenase domain-containing protein n=1 Tax=Phaseolus vulgaris TaxID=3885 RepID=V7C9Q0_PHAVU|nr:hypothetical protein PHAVU_003G083100g [Phaseolus vulgaris]ESW26000.1 hypothetical protein PHAVU_003G083100g [Phaseolus vulgaris]